MENLRSNFVSQLEKIVVSWFWTREDVACMARHVLVGLRIWRSGAGHFFPDLQTVGLQITGSWVRSECFSREFYLRMKQVEDGRYGRRRGKRMEGDVRDDLGMVLIVFVYTILKASVFRSRINTRGTQIFMVGFMLFQDFRFCASTFGVVCGNRYEKLCRFSFIFSLPP
ncbi:hypothetical protein DVH24_029364 [Malus domestica]|uniref:Uncharacterized protein n=1 Tax=Malus domestica TaxID=3750 RepID=A0A498I0J1_MALDO|nr:hypothetical protein DVH24_029364 [Malus domestica]